MGMAERKMTYHHKCGTFICDSGTDCLEKQIMAETGMNVAGKRSIFSKKKGNPFFWPKNWHRQPF
jgi:hypothetical protein